MIDLCEKPVEVANWQDLKPPVQHNHTAQNNPPSLPRSPDVEDSHPAPLTRVPHCIRHIVDAASSPHHKQVWIGSHTTTNISIFIMIQMQLGYQFKTPISACIPQKLPANCSSIQQLLQQQKLCWLYETNFKSSSDISLVS